MVAALIFFDFEPANRTKLDPALVLSPSLKLALHSFFAGPSFVQVIPALETYVSLAQRALYNTIVESLAPDKPFAARLSAPTHQRIFVDFRVTFECLVLFDQLLVVFEEVF
jgi:hypothetical protein